MIIQHSIEFEQYYSFVDKSVSLKHHGIKGQKWGVRRWQNDDGSLTAAGYPHYGVNKPSGKQENSSKSTSNKRSKEVDLSDEGEIVIKKGSKTYRTSGEEGDESKNNTRLYTNTNSKEKGQYIQEITDFHHQLGFESFAKEYEFIKDIKVPPISFQHDLEKNLVNDKEINKEIANWLKTKGSNKKDAEKFFTNYSQKRENVKNFLKTFSTKKMRELTSKTEEKRIMFLRNAMGDRSMKTLNFKYEENIKKAGYDAYRDTYDGSYDKKHSLVIFDSSGKVKQTKSEKITKEKYINQYIKNYIENERKPGTKISDLKSETLKNLKEEAEFYWEHPNDF